MKIDYIGTREAARLLGVSEASVRRWSDQGLLASHRVGHRSERRFERSEVLALKASGQRKESMAGPTVLLEGTAIPLHGHLISFYTSDEGRLRLGLPFLRDGIESGQTCVLLADQETAAGFERELAADGIDVGRARESGRLVRLLPFETSQQGLETLERTFSSIVRRGGVLIRFLGEATQNLERMGSMADLLRLEAQLDTLLHRFPVVTLCQYDARKCAGVDIVSALRLHGDNFSRPLGMFLN